MTTTATFTAAQSRMLHAAHAYAEAASDEDSTADMDVLMATYRECRDAYMAL